MVRVKKTITTKSVGLKKNGKGGERRTTCHSRNVGHQIKVGNKNKNDRAPTTETREGRSESPAPRDLTQKEGTKKSRKNRTTTIRASLPAAYRKERIEQKESKIEALTSDECIDLDELAKVEIDNEQGNGEYNQTNLSDMENAEKENAEKENAEMSTSKSSTNSNISALEPTQNRNIEFETKSCSNNQATFQYALESMDAAFYALGKFVGEKTCHDPSFDTRDEMPSGGKPSSFECSTGGGDDEINNLKDNEKDMEGSDEEELGQRTQNQD